MKRVARNIQNWPLAIALLGGVGLVISFLAPVFTTSVRWLLIAAVLALVLVKRRAFAWVQSTPGVVLSLCVVWGLVTTVWSMQPELSLMKSVAFALVTGALVSAGYRWSQVNPPTEALTFLFPLMVAGLMAALLGKTSMTVQASGSGIDLYRGLTDNSNMFGSLMFMIMPLLLWKAHIGRGRVRMVWSLLLAITAGMLLLSVARSSILSALTLAAMYGLSLSLARRASILFFGGLGVVTAVLMMPSTLHRMETQYVRKNAVEQHSNVLFSREGPWEISLNMAKQGGIIGAGYGVSIDGGSFAGGLTAVGYGREKGNTQLAIMEETGVVGLVLYVLIVFSLVVRMWRAFRVSRDRNIRALIGIITGAIIGELIAGIFEAWWVAPGAPESIWFWTMVGVALGLTESVVKRPATRTPASVAARGWASGPAGK